MPFLGSAVCVASLVCSVISLSTSHWVNFVRAHPKLNPMITNDKLQKLRQISDGTTIIKYASSNYGLWIGCFQELGGAKSCAFITGNCNANVCWIRESKVSKSTTCKRARVSTISSCVAFQVVRIITCIGVLLLTIGASLTLVSFCTYSRSLAAIGGLADFLASVLLMIGFAVFYAETFSRDQIWSIANIGYSLILCIASWPLALVGGFLSCCAASTGLRRKEISEYSTSAF